MPTRPQGAQELFPAPEHSPSLQTVSMDLLEILPDGQFSSPTLFLLQPPPPHKLSIICPPAWVSRKSQPLQEPGSCPVVT